MNQSAPHIIHLHEALPLPTARRVEAVINTTALVHNYHTLLGRVQAVSPATVGIAVVKADAYGHGIRPVAEALTRAGCRHFAVSSPEEALALRRVLDECVPVLSPNLFILILGYTPPKTAPLLAAHRITATLVSDDHAVALDEHARRAGVTLKVHAALDTGMNRIGYPAHTDAEITTTTASLLARFTPGAKTALTGLTLDGMFTHFARADEDYDAEIAASDSLTHAQYARYRRVLDGLTAGTEGVNGLRPRLCHICNSAAAVRFPSALPEGCLDAVRLGINLYGYGVKAPDNAPALQPAMRLCTLVSHMHTLLPGETVGYGGTFGSNAPRYLVTLPIGYADGWIRALTGATVTLHTSAGDFPAPVVGRICMDQCMLDITDLPPAARNSITPGTPVTLFGQRTDELEALATRACTITYELLCLITARVPRIYTEE